MRALVRVMSQVRADKTLDGIEAGAITPTLLHWVSLMKGGGDSAIMARWGQQARQRIDPEKWANLAITAATFAETSGQKERWIAFLKEWNIVESTVYNEFVAAREARAETKGEAKGQRQTLRDMLSRILRKKWEVEPSETVARKIEAEDNVALLQEWVDEAIFAQSFEAFRKTTKI